MKKLLTIMSATLLLSSCGLYNKYERPDVNTTGLVRDTASVSDTLAVRDTAISATCLGARCSPTRSCRR